MYFFKPQMNRESNERQEENLLEQDEIENFNRDISLDAIIDDLYILKNSLVINEELTPEAFSYLNQIQSLLDQFPELASKLYEWKFLEKEALYFLRTNRYIQILKIITVIISNHKKAPQMYFSKKFLFFITEKLYFAMGGRNIYKKEPVPDTILFSSMHRSNELLEEERSVEYEQIKPIMNFTKAMISTDRSVVKVLYDNSFFILANACICIETAEMFNQVFVDIVFSNTIENKDKKAPWTRDGLYEIRRQFFEPEVIFRNKNVFCHKSQVFNLKSGVYKQIYDQCTNIRDFADLSLLNVIDLLLYDKISYVNEEMEPLILEAKNPKVLRYYRRYLEAGGIPERGYLKSLIKAIDNSDTCRDVTIILYYYREFIEEDRQFTEMRVRSIIQNLEYQCNHECKMCECTLEDCKSKENTTNEYRSNECKIKNEATQMYSFDSNMCSNMIFGETGSDGIYNTPKESLKYPNSKSILEDFSEFHVDLTENQDTLKVSTTMEDCESYKIMKVIEHIYSLTDKKFFFKPTYLILFRSIIEHLPSEVKFITQFFNDFVDFIGINDMNISKVFLPVNKPIKRLKMREIQLSDDAEMNEIGSNECLVDENVSNIENIKGIKVNKGMIESDEE